VNHDDELDRLLARLRTAHRVAGIGSWEGAVSGDDAYDWSPEVHQITGWSGDRPPTFRDLVSLVHPDDRPALYEARAATIRGAPLEVDVRIVRPDQQVRHVHIRAELVSAADGSADRLVGVLQDRTDDIEAMRRIRVTEASRRLLLQRLLAAADHERERLARHLQQGAVARLAAVEEAMAASIGPESPPAWHEAHDSVRRSIASLQAALTTMADLRAGGDLAAVVVELTAGVDDVEVRADVQVDTPPSPAVRSVVVRVVQEALQNARKHACARAATVTVRVDGNAVHVTVADDGQGFDVEAATATGTHGHFGLASLREDVTAVGGTFELRSGPAGTTVLAALPLR
jgi:signal transduction histidine kinase